MDNTNTAVADRTESQTELSVKQYIANRRVEIEQMLPDHVNVERFVKSAMLAIARSDKLQKCSAQSVFSSIINAAELGLDFTPAKGHAYLVPFWNNKKKCLEAQFMPGYRGFIDLARRSGFVQRIEAHTVYENDTFQITHGSTQALVHSPDYFSDRGIPLGAYAVAYFNDGSYQVAVMNMQQLNAIKKRSKSRDRDGNIVGPWVTDEPEMQKKTTIRRIAKLLPLSPDMEKAIEYDNETYDVGGNIDKIESGSGSRTEALAATLAGMGGMSANDNNISDADFDDTPANVNTETGEVEPDDSTVRENRTAEKTDVKKSLTTEPMPKTKAELTQGINDIREHIGMTDDTQFNAIISSIIGQEITLAEANKAGLEQIYGIFNDEDALQGVIATIGKGNADDLFGNE